VEVSTGQFPYREWNSIFDQLTQVVQGDPPCLDVERDQFSPDFVDFVNTWWAVCYVYDCWKQDASSSGRMLVWISPVATVYHLSMPSIWGQLISTSESWE